MKTYGRGIAPAAWKGTAGLKGRALSRCAARGRRGHMQEIKEKEAANG